MRSQDIQEVALYSYISPEQRVPADHPLRPIREMVNIVLREISREFAKIYALGGRPSIPPERLLRALLLQVLYTVRSERMMMEQLDYNVLYRWFVGLNMDDAIWDVTVFTKNRERFLNGDIAEKFFGAVLEQARAAGYLSEDHFTVDGTLIEAWASQKSFKPKDEQSLPIGVVSRPRTLRWTFVVASAATRPMPQRPIQMRGYIRRAPAALQSWATWGIS